MSQFTHLTDGQTDRRIILIARPRLHSMHRGKIIPAIIGSKSAISLQRGQVDPKFYVERLAPSNHFS